MTENRRGWDSNPRGRSPRLPVFETGEGICLTDAEDLSSYFGELSHDGRSLLYSAGPQLRRRNLGDMSGVVLYAQPSPRPGGGVYYSATADHSRVVMVEMHENDRVFAKEGWDAFGRQWEVKPRCRLVEADLRTGRAEVIHEARCWLGHPNYRPDGRTIMFCHEGPSDSIPDSGFYFVCCGEASGQGG